MITNRKRVTFVRKSNHLKESFYVINFFVPANRKVVFEFAKHNVPGLPDGLLIDTDDKLWVAAIHGSQVIRIDPDTGDLLQTIVFPTSQVSIFFVNNT